MELSIVDRIQIMNALPQKAGFADMAVIRAMQTELNFSEDEVQKFEMRDQADDKGRVTLTWNQQKEEKKKFSMSKERERILKDAFISQAEKSEEIPENLTISIFKKLSWTQDQLDSLNNIVDKMDQEEKVTPSNFEICKAIKDKLKSRNKSEK
jgi:hypothetical protein